LLFYPEGGRSYSGEIKAPKTGLIHAALHAQHPHVVIVPTAVAYDLVLEDHVLAAPAGEANAAAVQPRSGGDGAIRRRLHIARVRQLRRTDTARRDRS
jgi:hypothetical protein